MLDAEALALRVKHAGEYGKHAAAKKAGFQKGDIIIRIDGRKERTSESELIGWLLEKHLPGESVETLVLRGSERIRLSLPMQ